MKLSKKIILNILLGTTISSAALSGAYYGVMTVRSNEERSNNSYALASSLLNMLTFDYTIAGVVDSIRDTYFTMNPETYPTSDADIEAYGMKYMDDLTDEASGTRDLQTSYFVLVNNVNQIATVSEDIKSVLVAFVDMDKKRLVAIAGSDSLDNSMNPYKVGSWRDLSDDSALLTAAAHKGYEEEAEIWYQLDRSLASSPIYLTALPFYRKSVAPQYANVLAYCIITQSEHPANNSVLIGTLSLIGASFGTGILLSVFLFLSLRKYVTKPIESISAEASRVSGSLASGATDKLSYESHLPSKRNDEIRTVDDSIGKMVVSAREALEKIKRDTNELEIASKIQLSALPSPHEEGTRFEVNGFMRPAKEVGGDFYDYFHLGGESYAVLVADVSGKGVPAAMFMMRGKALIKDRAYNAPTLSALFGDLNNELVANNDENLFLTCFMAIIDFPARKLDYISAGHDPMILLRDGKARELECDTNVVLGAIPGYEFKSQSIQLEANDLLFAYTDGLSEAMNETSELFGKERILGLLESFEGKNSEEAIAFAEGKVKEFTGAAEQSDDMTMVCLKLRLDNQIVLTDAENALADALDFASAKAKAAGCGEETIATIETALDEIVTNVLSYALKDKKPYIVIACYLSPDKDYIEFSIRDFGPAFNPLEAEEPDVSLELEDREVGGLGIFLVKNLMDEVRYSRVGRENILTIRKKVS